MKKDIGIDKEIQYTVHADFFFFLIGIHPMQC